MSEKRLFTMEKSSSHVGLVTFWLAAGTFAFGAGEFASMSLLPSIASGLGASEGEVGHIITAYAVGVVLGAPVIAVFGARWPRKPLLVALLAVLTLGNIFAAVSPSVLVLNIARFVSGIPHGAFIGLATLVAVELALPSKKARAVSSVGLGIPVATIIGVPVFTILGQAMGWRASYLLMALISAVALVALWATAPNAAGNKATSPKLELAAMKNPKVLMTLVTAAIGFGGIFAVYSFFTSAYESTDAGPIWAMSFILMLYGFGSTIGNWVAGFATERFLLGAAIIFQILLGLSAAVYALGMGNVWIMGIAMVLIGTSCGLVVPMQTRLMVAAGDARTLAAAMNHVAFNLANAIGPLVAGAAMTAGGGWASTGWVAVALAAGGLILLLINVLSDRKTPVTHHAIRFDPHTGTIQIVDRG
ncbi:MULTISPECIES: MFS transporter [Micrococcales]|uniref:MFS transporter n=1 Tax=Micrococcales TaxID=85006 RepID=UPI00068D764E|nr:MULTISPECIES: MFS transporter [Micrococcales]